MKQFLIFNPFNPENNPKIIQINVGRKLYSKVKLFVPKVNGKPSVDVGKRWYVYYYFENPTTQKKDKFTDTCKMNTLKTAKERKEVGAKWIESYEFLLANGFNPFTKEGIKDDTFELKSFTIKTALQYAFDNKIGTWKESTISDYQTRMNVFLDWINKNNLGLLPIEDFKHHYIIAFMNWLVTPLPNGRGVGLTSQDNYKRCLSGLFAKLVHDKIIERNFMLEIITKKDDPIKNTPFFSPKYVALLEKSIEDKNKIIHSLEERLGLEKNNTA